MIHFDAHVHSAVSPDSQMPPQVAIDTLAGQGLGCIFTEHLDYNRVDPDFLFDQFVYPETYWQYRSDSVKIGIELGMNPDFEPRIKYWAKSIPWDFVLGAVHWSDTEMGWDIYVHRAEMDWTTANAKYLRFSLEMVQSFGDCLTAFAHVDYPGRNAPPEHAHAPYADYAEDYDALFRALIARDIALEVNTRRFADPTARANWVELLRQYRRLGGRRVTIGSDAHYPENLGYQYKTALRMIEESELLLLY